MDLLWHVDFNWYHLCSIIDSLETDIDWMLTYSAVKEARVGQEIPSVCSGDCRIEHVLKPTPFEIDSYKLSNFLK